MVNPLYPILLYAFMLMVTVYLGYVCLALRWANTDTSQESRKERVTSFSIISVKDLQNQLQPASFAIFTNIVPTIDKITLHLKIYKLYLKLVCLLSK